MCIRDRLHREQKAAATVMTAKVSDPTGYGRIIREGNKVLDIREHKDATPEERTINEINAGFYCFDTSLVFSALLKVENNNRQGEYYLTDVIKILNREKKRVVAFELEDPEELHGINAVSYTHLDVYKRQDSWPRWIRFSKKVSAVSSFILSSDL